MLLNKNYFFSFIVIILSLTSYSQNIFKTDIFIINSNRLKVKISPENKIIEDSCIFILNNKILKVLPNELILFITNKDSVKFQKKISYHLPTNFYSLEYEINIAEINNKTFLPITTCNIDSVFLLNIKNILGFFKGFPYTINLNIYNENNKVYDKLIDYKSIISDPVSLFFETIVIDSLNIEMQYNKNNIIHKSELKSLIAAAIQPMKNKLLLDKINQKKLIFIFSDLSNNAGAIAQENTITFHFNENDPYLIKKTIIHELYHWILPTKKSWIDESLAEYLAIKMMLKSQLISEPEFLRIMSKKLKKTHDYKNSNLKFLYRNSSQFKILYTKGASLAWILDIVLLENSDYLIDIEQYILSPDSIEVQQLEKLKLIIQQFEKMYISENKICTYNKYLNDIGILFEQSKLVEVKEKQNLKLQKINNFIVIKNNANIEGILVNDTLISVDNKKTYKQITENLFSKSKINSCFVLLRNNKKIKISIKNVSVMQNLRFFLSYNEGIENSNWLNFKNSLRN